MENLVETKVARADAEILTDVLKELKWNRHVSEVQIGIDVRDGVVT